MIDIEKLVIVLVIVRFVDMNAAVALYDDQWAIDGLKNCESEIYCRGELLHTVQMAKVFNSSKTFVDMKLKQPPEVTLELFEEFMAEQEDRPTRDSIRKFVADNFDPPGSEFISCELADWRPYPNFLEKISDANYKQWAVDLHGLWKENCRQMIDDVGKNPKLYSIIPIANPVIVPGGRFREIYYWDSYWIIRGLLHSEMYETARGMLDNFLSLIQRFGYIPNGGRWYYLGRSQPPLLTGMIKSYVDTTDDTEFLARALPLLEQELHFFLDTHMVDVNGYAMAVYGGTSRHPRPESYVEDYELAAQLSNDDERGDLYSELEAAAESGMDFSSRWFIKNGTNEGELIDVKCHSIVPVELNAVLYWNAKILSEFHTRLHNPQKAANFEKIAQNFFDAVQGVLWDEEVGTWLDYDLVNARSRDYFVPTNLSPLWVGCWPKNDREHIIAKTMEYVERTGLDQYPVGVPNTLFETGEQWDYPNVWPPMQYILIEALRALNDSKANEMALSWTARWVLSNFVAYNRTHAMFEKYSAETVGVNGGGGEYDVQTGFGWTNGVILEFLAKNGDVLSSDGGF